MSVRENLKELDVGFPNPSGGTLFGEQASLNQLDPHIHFWYMPRIRRLDWI